MNKRLLSLVIIAIFVMVNAVGAFAVPSEKVRMNEKYGTPDFIEGDLTAPSSDSAEAIATNYLEANKSNFKADGSFKTKKLVTLGDEKVVRVQQTYNNLPVFGYEQKVLVDKNGVVKNFSGTVIPELSKQAKLKTNAKVSAADAVKAAKAVAGEKSKFETEPVAELGIHLMGNEAILAYYVSLSALYPQPVYMDVYVDAVSGQVVDKIDKLGKVTGTNTTNTGYGVLGDAKTINVVKSSYDGYYYLQDNTRPTIYTYSAQNGTSLPGYLWDDGDGIWNHSLDKAPVDAHYYAAKTYDYYKNKHSRNSWNGSGGVMRSTCHYQSNYSNAFWNGSQTVYGDGDGSTFLALCGGIDIVAHEWTHAVTGDEANLTYSYESGAISEAYSDIFGTLVEYYDNRNPDWLCGEDVYTPGTSGDALRSLANPPLYGDPDHYSTRYTGTSDNGGVHTNSGIINKVGYLIANGGTHYGVSVTGIGNDKLGAIFYRALVVSVVSSETMSQLRSHCLSAASYLYGSSSAEYTAVQKAFTSVGVN